MKLEHANLSVENTDEMERFLMAGEQYMQFAIENIADGAICTVSIWSASRWKTGCRLLKAWLKK